MTYNKANFLLEAFRVNNWYLDKLMEAQRKENPLGQGEVRNLLIKHVQGLKQSDADFKAFTDNLFKIIDSYRSMKSS